MDTWFIDKASGKVAAVYRGSGTNSAKFNDPSKFDKKTGIVSPAEIAEFKAAQPKEIIIDHKALFAAAVTPADKIDVIARKMGLID